MKKFEFNVYNQKRICKVSNIPNAIKFILDDKCLIFADTHINEAIKDALYGYICRTISNKGIGYVNTFDTAVLNENISIMTDANTNGTYNLIFVENSLECGIVSATLEDVIEFVKKNYEKVCTN